MVVSNSQVGLHSQYQSNLKHTQTTLVQTFYEKNNQLNENIQIQEFTSVSIQSTRAVYEYEEYMSLEDRIKKLMIEELLKELGNNTKIPVYPNKKTHTLIQQPQSYSVNPYHQRDTSYDYAIRYTQEHNYHQKQTIDFSASVKFQTPTQSYDMNIDLSFTKELYESHRFQLTLGNKNLIDPLVINFDEDINPFDNVSQLRFEFDLDNDGTTEMIPQLKNGAGYLALDKNDNGTIDNGSELFGPNTNDGFKELSQYDTDNNNWIDENDAVFDKLKIWSMDEVGNPTLVSLLDKNVGAIYLGEVQSGFKYQNAIERTDAEQKSNGIFLKEDGSGIGVVNSIDLMV